MLKVSDIKLPANHTEQDLANKINKLLSLGRIKGASGFEYKIIKRSIDARYKPDIFYIYTVAVSLPEKIEKSILEYGLHKTSRNAGKTRNNGQSRRNAKSNISEYKPVIYTPKINIEDKPEKRPVIVGTGPSGLFAGLILAYAGFKPVLLERGDSVENRINMVNKFWEDGTLDLSTNVQFGEGGAGTFSDGKLNTGVKDANGLNQFVLDTFVKFGASSECAYDSKPHVGTDRLAEIVKNIRNEIISLGGEVRFLNKMTEIAVRGGSVSSVKVENSSDMSVYELECDDLIIAIGHSALDTFLMLHENSIPMRQKDFAVGLRVQHPQELIDKIQYGDGYKEKYGDSLPAASYKLTNKTGDGRSVFSFCMCPGGFVVNASSEVSKLCVNGMSNSKRDSGYANSAVIVSVSGDDFGSDDVLAGMRFQEELERKAYMAGNGNIPVQTYGDFIGNKISSDLKMPGACFKGKTKTANLREVLPENISLDIIDSMEKFGYTMKGFDDENVILAGVESRTSSPVRILRGLSFESTVRGIYPCGEGAGYAGGIMSAAIDGIKVAEAIIKKYTDK